MSPNAQVAVIFIGLTTLIVALPMVVLAVMPLIEARLEEWHEVIDQARELRRSASSGTLVKWKRKMTPPR